MTSRSRSRIIVPAVIANRERKFSTFDPLEWRTVGGSVVTRSESEAMTDVVVKDYHTRIKRGDIINNPCTYEHLNYEHSEGAGSYAEQDSDTSNWQQYTGVNLTWACLKACSLGTLEVTPPFDMEASAKLKALSNIDSTPYAFGEDLLEIGETIKFIRRPFKGLADLAKAVNRKARSKRTQNALAKDVANAYAEYSWAFRPLLQSAMDAYSALTKIEPQLPPRLSARGFQTWNGSESQSQTGDNGWGTEYDFDRTAELELDCHASVLYRVTNPVRGVRHKLGLRNKDIPHTLWQIVPLSFMIDRVVDISASIQALANLADPKVEILAASSRIKTSESFTNVCTDARYPGWTYTYMDGGVESSQTFRYTRVPWKPSASDALPLYKGLQEDLVKDVQSIADLAAIIVQRLT